MPDDDIEERRLQDQRDLEFFSKRIRPTVGDLLWTNELSKKNNKISLQADKSDRHRSESLCAPATLADIYANRRRTTDHVRADTADRVTTAKTEILWLVVAVSVVLLAAWTGNPARIVEAIVF